MKILHEARRAKMQARHVQEERSRKELNALRAQVKAENEASGDGSRSSGKKRKRDRDGSDTDEFDAADYEDQGIRTSSRVNRARLQERLANRPPRRRSTRTAGSADHPGNLTANDFDEDWQKIPPEWLKSEDQEKSEDPDFGAAFDGNEDDDNAMNTEAGGNESAGEDESDLSILDEEEDLVRAASRGIISRRSPRKLYTEDHVRKAEESDFSALSADEDDGDYEFSDDGDQDGEGQFWPESAYNLGPSFDEEDQGSPEGFLPWEAVSTPSLAALYWRPTNVKL